MADPIMLPLVNFFIETYHAEISLIFQKIKLQRKCIDWNQLTTDEYHYRNIQKKSIEGISKKAYELLVVECGQSIGFMIVYSRPAVLQCPYLESLYIICDCIEEFSLFLFSLIKQQAGKQYRSHPFRYRNHLYHNRNPSYIFQHS